MEGFSCSCYCEGNAIVEEDLREFGDGGRVKGGGYDVLCSSYCRSGVDACVLVYGQNFVDSGGEGGVSLALLSGT